MKRFAHIVLSLWLSLLLLFGSTAMEFVHLFTGHTDTVHRHAPGNGLVFEDQHHHCIFLSFSLPAFLNQPDTHPVYYHKQVHAIVHSSIYEVFYLEQSILPSFRGPPTA